MPATRHRARKPCPPARRRARRPARRAWSGPAPETPAPPVPRSCPVARQQGQRLGDHVAAQGRIDLLHHERKPGATDALEAVRHACRCVRCAQMPRLGVDRHHLRAGKIARVAIVRARHHPGRDTSCRERTRCIHGAGEIVGDDQDPGIRHGGESERDPCHRLAPADGTAPRGRQAAIRSAIIFA